MSEEKQKEKGKGKVAHLPGPPQPNSPHRSPSPQPPLVVFPDTASSSLERMPTPAAATSLPGGLPGILITPWRRPRPSRPFPPLQRQLPLLSRRIRRRPEDPP